MPTPIRPVKAGAAAKKGADLKQAVTANRLSDGLVIFLATGERWTEHVAEAEVFTDPAALEAALDFGKRCVAERLLVEPYPIDVTLEAEGPVPSKLREWIRAFGPTARTDVVAPEPVAPAPAPEAVA